MTEYKKNYFEDRKLKYEKNHGVFIHEFMFTEFSNRILGQCNVALNDLQRQLDVEIARAKAEEKRLDQKINDETSRATAEERRLDGKIDKQDLTNLNQIKNNINKVLKYSNLYYSNNYDINEIDDNNKIDYTSILLTADGYYKAGKSGKIALDGVLEASFSSIAAALNQINTRLIALEEHISN